MIFINILAKSKAHPSDNSEIFSTNSDASGKLRKKILWFFSDTQIHIGFIYVSPLQVNEPTSAPDAPPSNGSSCKFVL